MSGKKKVSGARIDLPREEYDALCYMRDITCADLHAKIASLEERHESHVALEKKRIHSLNERDLEVTHLRDKNLEQHKLILQMQKRLAELEPVKSEVASPMFSFKAAK